jgi:YebC/PmpR family DNA-binding regulatory protein
MPKDTIDRAVARGAGADDGSVIEEALYEGFGPGGAALMIHTLTDNKNRALMNVKNVMAKHGGTFGGQNSVAWMFERKGIVRVAGSDDSDALTLELIDLGAEDVRKEDGGLTVTVAPDSVERFKTQLEAAGIPVEFAEATLIAKEPLEIDDDEKRRSLETLIELLEQEEDVDDVTTNADL